MHSDPDASPINPLPAIVWILALPMIAVEIVLSLGERGLAGGAEAVGWRLGAMRDYAVIPELSQWMVQTGQFPAEHLLRFVAYPFLNASFMQTVMAVVFLLALGNMVARIFAPWAVAVVFFGAAVAGAVAYSFVPQGSFPLLGGFPAVYGLIGAYSFLLWINQRATGGPQAQAFSLIAFLMGIQLVFSILFGTTPDWVADLAGFFAGFALSFLVCPGGWSRIVAILRKR